MFRVHTTYLFVIAWPFGILKITVNCFSARLINKRYFITYAAHEYMLILILIGIP